MIRLKDFLSSMAVLAVSAVMLGSTAQANADFKIRYSLDGGTTFTIVTDSINPLDPNTPGLDTNHTAGNIQVDLQGGVSLSIHASHIGTTTPFDTTFDLGVNGTNKGALKLVVDATITGINTGPPPLSLTYNFTGSVGSNAIGATQKFQTWVDDNNQFFGGASGVVGTDIKADTGSLSLPASGTIQPFTATDPYSVTAEVVVNVTASTLDAQGNEKFYSISNDSNNEITPVVPAPAGLLLVLAGAPVLAFGVWLRRRLNPVAL